MMQSKNEGVEILSTHLIFALRVCSSVHNPVLLTYKELISVMKDLKKLMTIFDKNAQSKGITTLNYIL